MAAHAKSGYWESARVSRPEECALCFCEIEPGEKCLVLRLHPNDEHLCFRCCEPAWPKDAE